jgi:gas vesicle protein
MLETLLAKEQNSRVNDKNALDSNYSRTMSDINSRHQQKIHDLTEALTKTKFDLESVTKEKEQIFKELS